MKNLDTRSAALILIACLSLGAASGSTTTGNVAAKTRPAPVEVDPFPKRVADGALGAVGATIGTCALVPAYTAAIVTAPFFAAYGL